MIYMQGHSFLPPGQGPGVFYLAHSAGWPSGPGYLFPKVPGDEHDVDDVHHPVAVDVGRRGGRR
jgi:hypothetical protein